MRLDPIEMLQQQVDEIINGLRQLCVAGWRLIRRAEG
jgi:hypothetical protein